MLGIITRNQILNFFIQLLSYYKAGINLNISLGNIIELTKDSDLKNGLSSVKSNLDRGMNLSDSLVQSSMSVRIRDWEISLIRVGESSGDLEKILELLIRIRTDDGKMYRSLITRLLYPIILFHLAAIILNIPVIFLEGFFAFLLNAAIFLGILYLVLFLIFLLFRIDRIINGALFFQRFLMQISFTRDLYLSRFFSSLGHLFDKNFTTFQVFKIAASTTGNRYLESSLDKLIGDKTMHGKKYSDILSRLEFIPVQYLSMINAGEESGKLDTMLAHLARETYDTGREGLNRLTIVLPVIIFLIIAAYIGYRIVSAFAERFNQIANF